MIIAAVTYVVLFLLIFLFERRQQKPTLEKIRIAIALPAVGTAGIAFIITLMSTVINIHIWSAVIELLALIGFSLFTLIKLLEVSKVRSVFYTAVVAVANIGVAVGMLLLQQ